jgi:hypothetical protein
VIRLEDELGAMRRRVARLEREMRAEIQKVHKHYRRELVLWQEPRLPATRR